jgi:hypothetical protein
VHYFDELIPVKKSPNNFSPCQACAKQNRMEAGGPVLLSDIRGIALALPVPVPVFELKPVCGSGSGEFLTCGSGSRVQDTKPIFLIGNIFLDKNTLFLCQLAQIFLYLLKIKIISNLVKLMATKREKTISPPPSFFCCC